MAETYQSWKKQFPIAKPEEDLLRKTYEWHRRHPKDDDLAHYLDLKIAKHGAPDYSFGEKVQQALSPPSRSSSSGEAQSVTNETVPTAAGTTNPANPDAANVKTGNPQIDAAIQAALAGGSTAGSVTLWPSLGVDPNASVLGTKKDTKPGVNTMDALGLLHHGTDIDIEVPVTRTADEWLKGLYKMSPAELKNLQQRLWSQGWYTGTKVTDPSMIQYGRPDAATLAAYAEVLGETARYNAAQQRIGINGVLDMGSPNKGLNAAGQGSPYEKTNPADLAAALRSQAQQELGRDPTAEEQRAFEQKYLADEDAARRQLIAAGAANRTVGVTGPPSPTAGAAEFIDTHNLVDRAAYGAAVRQQAFFGLLRSPV